VIWQKAGCLVFRCRFIFAIPGMAGHFLARTPAVFPEGRHVLHSSPAFRFATLPAPDAGAQGAVVLWRLKRHSALTPAQLGWFYLSLCMACLGVAAYLWSQNASAVMAFALLAVGAACVLYLRHAGDAEKIVLQDGQLVVELESAGRTQRAAFNREWAATAR
jgi:Integral membrane protein (DUF2244)